MVDGAPAPAGRVGRIGAAVVGEGVAGGDGGQVPVEQAIDTQADLLPDALGSGIVPLGKDGLDLGGPLLCEAAGPLGADGDGTGPGGVGVGRGGRQ